MNPVNPRKNSALRMSVWRLYSQDTAFADIAEILSVDEKYVASVVKNMIQAETAIIRDRDRELSLLEKASLLKCKYVPQFALLTDNQKIKDLAKKLKMI